MSSLFQEMEEFTLFDGLVPSSNGFGPGVEDLDKFDVGFGIPGDSLVKDEYGPGELFEDVLSSGSLEENNWMETVDLSCLLGDNSLLSEQETIPNTTKSGRLLEELLTQPIKIKSSPTVPKNMQYDAVKVIQNDSVKNELVYNPTEVLNQKLDHSIKSGSILEEAMEEIDGINTLILQQQLQELYDSNISHCDTSISDGATSNEVSLLDSSNSSLMDVTMNEFIASPLSSEDIDNILSSPEPASPSSSIQEDPDYVPYISDGSTNKKSKKSQKEGRSKTKPYDKPVEKLDKKERKRIQNRNAAIRYREKKRQERGTIHSDEDVLSDKNKELKTKVEQLVNEISYMKNLLTEVCQARGLKIQFK
ncbi:uncharacterized protein LOC127707439 [Mytilus californianus]|uniref:uncharacterized protein LOC127707439 n=1 Tax=Mytilus californianus TaxID=6549 RepID=UPI00224593C8|nr:uncharacterized protein LOC127707439 [Mytilus californianus]